MAQVKKYKNAPGPMPKKKRSYKGKEYTEVIGFERELDKDKFDKELLNELAKQAEQFEMEAVKQVEDTVKQCYLKGTTAYITFGGYMINPKEFCAIRVGGFHAQFSKK